MNDLISRQAVLNIWHTSYSNNREENEEIQYRKIAFELPSIKLQPNKGHWIEHQTEFYTPDRWRYPVQKTVFECGFCHRRISYDGQRMNYCPNCGADMQEVEG